MAKKKITREDSAGLRLLRSSASSEEVITRQSMNHSYDGGPYYNKYNKGGYYDSRYGEYVYEGGCYEDVVIDGYRNPGGSEWSSGIPPWGDTDNPFIDREYPGYEGNIWFDIYEEDYYYYNSPYYDVYDTEVGGSPQEDPRKDGVDVTNKNHFYFKGMEEKPAFQRQLMKIMESNSVLKELLVYFDRGYVSMILQLDTFTKADEIGSAAITKYDPNTGQYSITFNDKCIDENGWTTANATADSTGFDWSTVRTAEEALVVILTHESMHARHFAIYNSICNDISKKQV